MQRNTISFVIKTFNVDRLCSLLYGIQYHYSTDISAKPDNDFEII